jgi:hypothetical protein
MDCMPSPLVFLLLLFSGWVNREQAVIDYPREPVLRAAHRPQLNLGTPAARLAAKRRVLSRRRLCIAGIVTPDTILR